MKNPDISGLTKQALHFPLMWKKSGGSQLTAVSGIQVCSVPMLSMPCPTHGLRASSAMTCNQQEKGKGLIPKGYFPKAAQTSLAHIQNVVLWLYIAIVEERLEHIFIPGCQVPS